MIPNTPIFERPRERCLSQGAECLSLRECLALLLGSGPPGIGAMGVASGLVTKPGTGLGPHEEEHAFFASMEMAASAHLKHIRGLGEAGQARILAAFELGRRYANFREREHAQFQLKSTRQLNSLPELALDQITLSWRTQAQEWLGFVPIFRNARPGALCIVERGVRTHVNVDPVELFARILTLRPEGFFLFHNHPSGNLQPSESDRDLTHRIRQLSDQLGIRFLGHGIVTTRGERWIVV